MDRSRGSLAAPAAGGLGGAYVAMSAIIKSGDSSAAAKVRAFSIAEPAPAPEPASRGPDAELFSLRRELEAMARKVQDRDAEIALAKDEINQALVAGEAEGLRRGRIEGEARRGEHLDALRSAIDRALELLRSDMASLERLAAQLAVESVSIIVGEPVTQREMLTQIIRKQLAQLNLSSVVRIEVSAVEFEDAEALSHLRETIGHSGVRLQASDGLGAGECRFKLVLGELEVGAGQQWARLSAALLALAQP